MTNQVTVDKLIEMRLSAMSDAFLIQLNDSKMKDMVPISQSVQSFKMVK